MSSKAGQTGAVMQSPQQFLQHPVSRAPNSYVMSRRFCYVIAASLHYASVRTGGLRLTVTDSRARRPPFDARHVHNCPLFAAAFRPALRSTKPPLNPGTWDPSRKAAAV